MGNAVVRNRTKRRLRALVDARLGSLPTGVDIVVRANPCAADVDTPQLSAALDRALARIMARLEGQTRGGDS